MPTIVGARALTLFQMKLQPRRQILRIHWTCDKRLAHRITTCATTSSCLRSGICPSSITAATLREAFWAAGIWTQSSRGTRASHGRRLWVIASARAARQSVLSDLWPTPAEQAHLHPILPLSQVAISPAAEQNSFLRLRL